MSLVPAEVIEPPPKLSAREDSLRRAESAEQQSEIASKASRQAVTNQKGDENLKEEKMVEQAPEITEKSMNESDTLEIEEEILRAKL